MSGQSAETVSIALDAMGGDDSPKAIVEGVRLLEREFAGTLFLVGQEEAIRGCGSLPRGAEIVPCEQVVSMHEPPSSALRKKRDSSVARAVRLVKEGRAQAVISAGNTGAFMAFSVTTLGRLKGIQRPAIATLIPTRGEPCILIDVGANVDCRPDFLLDFAIMGKIYVEKVLGRKDPSVGLLSIGQEEGKGNELTQAVKPLLESAPLRFVGNVEGRDIPQGRVDVIVCDGFVGNVILKFGEGLCEMIFLQLGEEYQRLKRQAGLDARQADVFERLMASTDYSEYGGAPLLGVNGNCIVCHGTSSPKAIANAIRSAYRAIEFGVNPAIQEMISTVRKGECTVGE